MGALWPRDRQAIGLGDAEIALPDRRHAIVGTDQHLALEAVAQPVHVPQPRLPDAAALLGVGDQPLLGDGHALTLGSDAAVEPHHAASGRVTLGDQPAPGLDLGDVLEGDGLGPNLTSPAANDP